MPSDPIALFDQWLAEAHASEPNDAEAMALASADAEGRPSVRMVLLKGHGPEGFTFYTNLGSRKGGELAANPNAALMFHWKTLRRSVRVEGPVEPVPADEADAYYVSRTRDSQIGAWASDQSRPLDRRETLEARFAELAAKFDDEPVPRPPHWAGFRVKPRQIEFWTDGEHRLHHRLVFTWHEDRWTEGLLYP
jgi:pyridoxamine 5'-phosphate oxidase